MALQQADLYNFSVQTDELRCEFSAVLEDCG